MAIEGYLPNGRPIPKKRKKKKPVTSAQQNKQGRGGVAPANYNPDISKPKPTAPIPQRQPKEEAPKMDVGLKRLLKDPDALPYNIENMTTANMNRWGVRPTAQQAMELLQTAGDKPYSTNEWGQFLAPAVAHDPFTTELQEVIKMYFGWTGRIPDEEQARQMVMDKRAGKDITPKTIKLKFGGLSILDAITGNVNATSANRMNRNTKRWTEAEIKRLPGGAKSIEAADRARALANAPQRVLGKDWDAKPGEEGFITNADIDRINEVREWYGGTKLKHRINKRKEAAAQELYQQALMNPDGTDNKAAVKFLAQLSGQLGNGVDDPHAFATIRTSTFGKTWDQLKPNMQEDIKILGSKLASVYADFKPPADGKFVWNAEFDRYASLYLFMSSIGRAIQPNYFHKDDPDEYAQWKAKDNEIKAATANISIATYGKIKAGDDMREYFNNMGFLGDPEQPGTWSQQLTNWLFNDCYLKTEASPGESLEASVWKFAARHGGRDGLPAQYQPIYDELKRNWSTSIVALQKEDNEAAAMVNPLYKLFNAQVENLNAARAAYTPAITMLQKNAAMMEPGSSIMENPAADRSRRERPAENEGEGFDTSLGQVVPTSRGLAGRPLKSDNVYGTSAAFIMAKAPTDPYQRYFNEIVVPNVTGAVSTVLDWTERKKNEVYLTLYFMSHLVDSPHTTIGQIAYQQRFGPVVGAAYGTIRGTATEHGPNIVKAGIAAQPEQMVIPLSPNAYSWSNIQKSWDMAHEASKELEKHPWMREEFKEVGLDPDENGGMLFWADLGWSVGVDFALDGAVGGLAKIGTTTSAKVMRQLSSSRIKLAEEIAFTKVRVEKGAKALAEIAEEEDYLLKAIDTAVRHGDENLAQSFRRRLKAIRAENDPTLLGKYNLTREEQLAADLNLVLDPKEAHILEDAYKEESYRLMGAEAQKTTKIAEQAKEAADAVKAELHGLTKKQMKEAKKAAKKEAKAVVKQSDRTEYEQLLQRIADARISGDEVEASRLIKQAERMKLEELQNAAVARGELSLDLTMADSNLMHRPLWFDTFATGLAKREMTGLQVEMVLGVKSSHVEPERASEFLHCLEQIGRSYDEDYIIRLMNFMRHEYGLNLDPGRLFMGRMHHYRKIMGSDMLASINTVLPNDSRIASGARDVTSHAYTLGHLTRMGLAPGRESEARKILWTYLERLHNIDRNMSQVAINRERQQIWNEMNEVIRNNMKARKASKASIERIRAGAKKAGFEVPHNLEEIIDTEWAAFQASGRIKNWKQLGKHLERGGGKKANWYDEVQSDRPWLIEATKDKQVTKKIWGKHRVLTRAKSHGQQANDLIAHFNLQDLANYQAGKMWALMERSTPMFGISHAPTFMGMANAGRTLAVASMSFPISALFIDEFYRLGIEMARGNMSLRKYRTMKAMTEGHGLREAGTNAVEDLFKNAHEIIPIRPDDPMYLTFLNRWLAAFKDQDFFDEYVSFMSEFTPEDLATLSADNIKVLYNQHLHDFVFDWANADVRDVMASTGRGLKHGFDEPGYIIEQQQEWDDEFGRLQAAISSAKKRRDELIKERQRLNETEVTVLATEELSVQPKLTQKVLDGVFKDYQKTDVPAIRTARAKFLENNSIENWNNLKTSILDDIEARLKEVDDELTYATERAAAKPEPPATPKTAEEAMAEPAPVVTEPDFEPIPEPMVRPELMMDEDYLPYTTEWLLENVEGLKYNKKTGEWNTKAYQREQAGYDSHAAFMNGGEEYEDDIDVIQELMEENAEDIRFQWVGDNGDDMEKYLPEGWEMQSTDRYHFGGELDTGETFDFYVQFDEGDNMWHLVEETAKGEVTPRGKVDFNTLDDAIRSFERRRLEEAAPATQTPVSGPSTPPEGYLYHGSQGTVESIREHGLKAQLEQDESVRGISWHEGTKKLDENPEIQDFHGHGNSGGFYRVKKTDMEELGFDVKYNKKGKFYETEKANPVVPPEKLEYWNKETGAWEPVVQEGGVASPVARKVDSGSWTEGDDGVYRIQSGSHKWELYSEVDDDAELRLTAVEWDGSKLISTTKLNTQNIDEAREQIVERLNATIDVGEEAGEAVSIHAPIKWGRSSKNQTFSSDRQYVIVQDQQSLYHIYATMGSEDIGDWVAHTGGSFDNLKEAKLFLNDKDHQERWDEFDELIREKNIDNAPENPPKDYEATGETPPDIEDLQRQKRAIESELRMVKRARKPKSLTKPVVIERPYPERTTTIGNLLDVPRPQSKAYIAQWLRDNKLISDDFFAFQDWEWSASFKDQAGVRLFFKNNNIDMKHYDQMYDDYKSWVYANRGVTDDAFEGAGLKIERDALDAKIGVARGEAQSRKKDLRTHKKRGRPRSNELTKDGEEYVDSVVERTTMFANNPVIFQKIIRGEKLTRKELKEMREAGIELPPVMGARGSQTTWYHGGGGQLGYIPFLSKFAEWGPYRALNWMGNKTREVAFLGNFSVEYRAMLARGVSPNQAIEAATHRALDYVDKVMYSPGQTLLESQLGAYFYFLPAFRQATLYWGKQLMKNPFVMANARERLQTDMPMMYGQDTMAGIPMPEWWSDYGIYVPLPFFATNSLSEAAVPGASMPILVPLRAINMMTGWDEVTLDAGDPATEADDKKKIMYTGNTKLDWMTDSGWLNPITGFASKKVSPLSFIDTIAYGMFGESSYWGLQTDNWGMAVFATALMAMRKDPMVARKAAASIMLAQIANGDKPNTSVFEKRAAGAPWWYDALIAVFGDTSTPENILGGVTRQLLPRKLVYSPSDLDADLPSQYKETRKIFEQVELFGDEEARTMAEAEYEYWDATGDWNKQKAILAKYPKLAEKMDFFKKNAYDRELYLMEEKNRWLIPYVTGKNNYSEETGAPLTNEEYAYQMSTGAMVRRENKDLLLKVGVMYDNAEWSEVLKELEDVRDQRNKQAHTFMVNAIKKDKRLTPELKQARLDDLEGYENKWWGYTAPSEYDIAKQQPKHWMNVYAYEKWGKDYLKHQLKWNTAAITDAHFQCTMARGEEGRDYGMDEQMKGKVGKRPVKANYEGIEGYYSNATAEKSGASGIGDMRRITDALNRFLEPDDKKLFGAKNSISYNAIKKKTKEDNDKRRYEMKKILETPYYYIESSQQLESAMPGIFTGVNAIGTALEMDVWLEKAQVLYAAKVEAQAKYDSWDDEYKAINAQWEKTMAKMMNQRIAEPFRNGAAGMMMYTYLTDPGEGKKYSETYTKYVAKELMKKEPDYEDIVDFDATGFKRPEIAEAANAWAGLFTAARELQAFIRKARVDDYDDIHVGDAQDLVRKRLLKYISSWSRHSDLFKQQWGDEGGDKMIESIMKEAF